MSRYERPPGIYAHGWTYHDACTCGGYREKYRHPVLTDLELEWIPGADAFRVTYRGSSTKIPPTRLAQLDKILAALNEKHKPD